MKIFAICVLVLAVVCMGIPAIASCGSCGSGSKAAAKNSSVDNPALGDSPEKGLDDKIDAGTSGKLAAQGPIGYDDETGLANVVPSDSEGDIED